VFGLRCDRQRVCDTVNGAPRRNCVRFRLAMRTYIQYYTTRKPSICARAVSYQGKVMVGSADSAAGDGGDLSRDEAMRR
jgi:hypothetical protein